MRRFVGAIKRRRSRRAALITKHTSVTFRLSMIYLKPNSTHAPPAPLRAGASIEFSSDAIAGGRISRRGCIMKCERAKTTFRPTWGSKVSRTACGRSCPTSRAARVHRNSASAASAGEPNYRVANYRESPRNGEAFRASDRDLR